MEVERATAQKDFSSFVLISWVKETYVLGEYSLPCDLDQITLFLQT